ncbi:protein SIX6OS1 [Triplophysa rosa]|uniref:Neurofilament medium polypeptide-like n=1 Tax=Triplophysa rosa TaxID=992332 RepID=A0A9W7WUW2_TRIRA|nr:protein SIX6OS1 [Triplophysa rosa]KAI7808704.1 putative neurofilament medium polypeptide-like [Triplophysa rosa]
MEEQTVNQLDNLLFQLGIETRELGQRRDDVKQQIQIFESSIQEKKDYINTTQKTVRKLDEDIQQKQATVKFIRENTKNHQQTGSLLLQYEKTLEAELEKRRDSYNQDMTIFQERIESYRSVFQQHKDRYCMSSLAQKLLQVQAKNEEIEKRIRVTESQITEKERELTAALGVDDPVALSKAAECNRQENEALQTDNNEEVDCHQDPEMQTAAEDGSDPTMIVEEFSEEKPSKTAGSEDMSECDTEMFHYSSWQKTDSAGDQINEGGQKQSEEVNEQVKTSSGSEVTVETLEENGGGDVDKTKADILEDTTSEGVICPPPSPARMKAVLTTPTFSLNNSPVGSPGRPDISESKSPAFVFSVNSAPSTPAFSRLACDFDMGSTAEEASPFTFTSSYFSDKKSPGSGAKFSGFLFDEGENHQEEFSFSFSSDSTQQNSSTQQTEGPDDSFPFTFSFS